MSQYVENYKSTQNEMKGNSREAEDGYMDEKEVVWYILDTFGKWSMRKAKLETIEKIHLSGRWFKQNVILATCHNVLENYKRL